jgi:hypothetical protein
LGDRPGSTNGAAGSRFEIAGEDMRLVMRSSDPLSAREMLERRFIASSARRSGKGVSLSRASIAQTNLRGSSMGTHSPCPQRIRFSVRAAVKTIRALIPLV